MDNHTGNAKTFISKTFTDLHHIIQQLPVATVVLSDYGQRVEYANDAFLRTFNKERETISNNPSTAIFADVFHPHVQQTIRKAGELGASVKEECIKVSVTTKSGIEDKYLDFHAVPLLDDQGKPTSIILLNVLDSTVQIQS
ncbi:MAG TPA: PAS domain-containing protein, partial [Chryseolinea sp.]|nr:PAS domain-containing protein [Chryseolinea sp.]